MATNENILSLNEVSGLLPEGYKIMDKVERSLYTTDGNSVVAIGCSKLYDDNTFWYSLTTDYFVQKGVTMFCLIAGLTGIFFIPKETLQLYGKRSGWKQQKKGRSYYVRIKLRSNRYYLFSSEQEDIDITDRFISK